MPFRPGFCSALTLVVLVCCSVRAAAGEIGARSERRGEIFVSAISDASGSIDDAMLDYYTEIVRDGARKYATGFMLIDRENAELILKDFGLNLKDCMKQGQKDCEVMFGERIQADMVVSGQILKMPDGLRIVLKIHDVAKRRPLSTVIRPARDIADVENQLADVVPELFMSAFKPEEIKVDVALPPPDPSAGYGMLFVKTTPAGADITLNGQSSGKSSPFLFEHLAVGYYKIDVESPRGRTREIVKVIPGQIVKTDIQVPANKLGSLLIETTPSGLTVVLDGKEVGKSPLFLGSLVGGPHDVSAEGTHEGRIYSTSNGTSVVVDAGSRKKVMLTASSLGSVRKVKAGRDDEVISKRRTRTSFQGRLSGGLDLNRAAYGVAGLVQVGVGTGRWFDIHSGVGFPGYIWVTDFELNMYPFGRFVPTLALRVGLGFDSSHKEHSVEGDVGLEFWIINWLALYLKVGVGYTWNLTTDRAGLIVPGWIGVEMRY